MRPKIAGSPLVAWRDDTTLQLGWGEASLTIEDAPHRLPDWLALLTGTRTNDSLLRTAAAWGIGREQAQRLLLDMGEAGLLEVGPRAAVSVSGSGALCEPLTQALSRAGLTVLAQADIEVFVQGQLPSLVGAGMGASRMVPLWFGPKAVHIGPVLDQRFSPCPECVDRHWQAGDPQWPALVAQAASAPNYSDPGQLILAAAGVALVVAMDTTVGLEMILDPSHPGPRWRVWGPHPQCRCQRADIQ